MQSTSPAYRPSTASIHGQMRICAGEAIWLVRLRDGQSPTRLYTADDFPSTAALVETWRAMDAEWETYVATLTDVMLAADITWHRQERETFSCKLWQPVTHIAFHSTEHRGHASVALTQLGIKHGPQDFLYQFLPPPSVVRPMGPTA